MTLAIKHIHNLPPHIRYVSTLPEHKNWNATLTSWSTDIWDCIPQDIIEKATDQWQTWLHPCVKAKGRHFEHLL